MCRADVPHPFSMNTHLNFCRKKCVYGYLCFFIIKDPREFYLERSAIPDAISYVLKEFSCCKI